MGSKIKPVFWTTRAKKDLDKIMQFTTELYGIEKAKETAYKIHQRIHLLENSDVDLSKVGVIDTAFSHLKNQYRKLLFHHYKITYREGKTKIYVVRVFDTRQHPNKNK